MQWVAKEKPGDRLDREFTEFALENLKTRKAMNIQRGLAILRKSEFFLRPLEYNLAQRTFQHGIRAGEKLGGRKNRAARSFPIPTTWIPAPRRGVQCVYLS